MPSLNIVPDLDRAQLSALKDKTEDQITHLKGDGELEVGALPHGMESGAPSVAFAFKLPDGQVVLAETSLALLLTAADAFKAVHGDPREGT